MKVVIFLLYVTVSTADFWKDRKQLLQKEESQYLGHKIKLTPKEESVNKKLMIAKNQELAEGFIHPEKFPPAIHFFRAKEKINKSPVYKFIQKMPKGGALHIHDTALNSVNYVINNITYRHHLYICKQRTRRVKLRFANLRPRNKCWKSLNSIRQNGTNAKRFDGWLKRRLSLETDKPEQKYPDINTVWKKFQGIFDVQTPMITYNEVFVDYYYRALQEFRADNVNYMEIRGSLPLVYDLNGNRLHPVQVLELIKKVCDKFLANYPDFIGIKFIYSRYRRVNNETMNEYLETFKNLKQKYPDFLVGFDLVGQEDLGEPLVEFVNKLLEVGPDVKFFFHAGETNWNGMSTDLNLVDALLLNTTRIGHGFALLKHPAVMEEARKRGVAVEVCPISHQVLGLVKDLRNHPASALLAQDFPVVVSSDDPGFWGAAPLSHDFYEVFMGVASQGADLRLLKQLALNSLVYSSLNHQAKGDAINKFQKKWDQFIDDVHTNGFE